MPGAEDLSKHKRGFFLGISSSVYQLLTPAESHLNLNPLHLGLDPALTRASVALPMTPDLRDIIHQHTERLVLAVKRPLNGPPTSPLLSPPFTADRGGFSMARRAPSASGGHTCVIDTERHEMHHGIHRGSLLGGGI